jgi:hypothetical protein
MRAITREPEPRKSARHQIGGAVCDWSATHRIAFGRIHQADTIRTRPPFCLLLTVCFTVACFLCWARQGQILQNTSPAAFVLGSATCAHLPSTERGRTSGPQIRKAEPTTHRATNKSTIVSLVIPTRRTLPAIIAAVRLILHSFGLESTHKHTYTQRVPVAFAQHGVVKVDAHQGDARPRHRLLSA